LVEKSRNLTVFEGFWEQNTVESKLQENDGKMARPSRIRWHQWQVE
jgi:hypothetical protein